MIKYLVLAICIIYVNAAHVDPGCMWGDWYVCSSLRVAKRCESVQRCTDTVWQNFAPRIVVNPDKPVCRLCKQFMVELQKYLSSKEKLGRIEKIVEKMCMRFMGDKELSMCKAVTAFYMKMIQKVIDKRVLLSFCDILCSPSQFANQMEPGKHFTQPMTSSMIKKEQMDVTGSPILCSLCNMAVTQLLAMLANPKQLTVYLDKFCGMLPQGFQPQCKILVNTYGPMVIQMLLKEFNPKTICTTIHLCTSIGLMPDI